MYFIVIESVCLKQDTKQWIVIYQQRFNKYLLSTYKSVKWDATVLDREHTLKVTIFFSGSLAEYP